MHAERFAPFLLLLEDQHAFFAALQIDREATVDFAKCRARSEAVREIDEFYAIDLLDQFIEFEEEPVFVEVGDVAHRRAEDVLASVPIKPCRLVQLDPSAQDIAVTFPLLQCLVFQRQAPRAPDFAEETGSKDAVQPRSERCGPLLGGAAAFLFHAEDFIADRQKRL